MTCGKCGESFADCKCPDIDDRLKRLRNNDHYIYKMCSVCGKHYARCKCEEPVWVSSHEGFPIEKIMNTPTFADIIESEKAKARGQLQ